MAISFNENVQTKMASEEQIICIADTKLPVIQIVPVFKFGSPLYAGYNLKKWTCKSLILRGQFFQILSVKCNLLWSNYLTLQPVKRDEGAIN